MTEPDENWSVEISFFWKPEKIKGDTPYGNVDIKGGTYGLGVTVNF